MGVVVPYILQMYLLFSDPSQTNSYFQKPLRSVQNNFPHTASLYGLVEARLDNQSDTDVAEREILVSFCFTVKMIVSISLILSIRCIKSMNYLKHFAEFLFHPAL